MMRKQDPTALSIAASLAISACAEPGGEIHRADALVYASAACEETVWKWETCAPLPEYVEPVDFDECVEIVLRRLKEEPCYAELLEFDRCGQERLSCEEYFDLEIMTAPGTPCHAQVVAIAECHDRHPDTDG